MIFNKINFFIKSPDRRRLHLRCLMIIYSFARPSYSIEVEKFDDLFIIPDRRRLHLRCPMIIYSFAKPSYSIEVENFDHLSMIQWFISFNRKLIYLHRQGLPSIPTPPKYLHFLIIRQTITIRYC